VLPQEEEEPHLNVVVAEKHLQNVEVEEKLQEVVNPVQNVVEQKEVEKEEVNVGDQKDLAGREVASVVHVDLKVNLNKEVNNLNQNNLNQNNLKKDPLEEMHHHNHKLEIHHNQALDLDFHNGMDKLVDLDQISHHKIHKILNPCNNHNLEITIQPCKQME
jgi:hypothetical protein